MSELLTVDGLSVRFRNRSRLAALIARDNSPYTDAVSGVSFDIHEGETFAVVGESGSGKSTLARAIFGFADAHEGSILYQGRELRGGSERALRGARQGLALMFQDAIGSLSPRLRAGALIGEPLRIRGFQAGTRKEEVARLLSQVGLGEQFMDRFPHELSGGQARRVGFARALATSPRLLIADEPTAGLDVSVQGEVLNLMAEFQNTHGISILIITHNLSVVRHVADRMAIMRLGRFVEQGPATQIFTHPEHDYTKTLLSAHSHL